jgi:ATP-binding cassette, subfamily C, bacterial CydC
MSAASAPAPAPPAAARAGAGAPPIRRMLALARPLRATLVVAVLAGVLSVGCGVALLGVSGFLIARASEHPNEVALALAVVGVRAFGLGRGVLRYIERLASHDAAFRVLADLRVSVFRRLERLAGSGYRQLRGGDLVTRLVSDVDGVQEVFVRGLTPPLVAFGVGGGTVIAATALYEPAGAALAGGLLFAGIAVPGLATVLARRADSRLAAARGELTARAGDIVAGAAELIAYGADRRAIASFDAADAAVTRLTRRVAVVTAVGSGLTTAAVGATVWAILLQSVSAQHGGQLSRVGTAAVVLTGLAAFEATGPLGAAAQQLSAARGSARRLFEVIDLPDPVAEPAAPLDLPPGPMHLRVSGARLRYEPAGPDALDGVDLDLPPGHHVALVGRSGAGKSTLVTALMRFRDLDQGEISLGGVPITRFASDDVRRAVSGCLADPHIFDSTIRENLRLARPAVSQRDLDDVAARMQLLDWIRALPLGWDTPVGSHGSALSGGQRQRLALARALLADPAVLILDEPTAHLDELTADALMADIRAATRGRTLLLITHDMRHTGGFDDVVVLDAGRVSR